MMNQKVNAEMMQKFHIDHANKTIVMPKNIAKRASIYGTDEYNAFLAYQSIFPNYEIKIREIKKHSARKGSKDGLRGLTYEYMERFLKSNGNEEQEEEYRLLRNPKHDDGLESEPKSYVEIRRWFLKTFPQVLEYQKRVDQILNGESA